MNYRRLGKSGIQVSELSFGSWVTFHTQAGIDETVEMMAAAYDSTVSLMPTCVWNVTHEPNDSSLTWIPALPT